MNRHQWLQRLPRSVFVCDGDADDDVIEERQLEEDDMQKRQVEEDGMQKRHQHRQ